MVPLMEAKGTYPSLAGLTARNDANRVAVGDREERFRQLCSTAGLQN